MPWKPADPSYSPDIDPSELRHQITQLVETTINDSSGAAAEWAPSNPPLTVYAAIDEPRGQMVVQDGQDISKVDAIIRIRYRAGVAANQRWRDATGNDYLVLSVTKPKGMNVLLLLFCQVLGTNQ